MSNKLALTPNWLSSRLTTGNGSQFSSAIRLRGIPTEHLAHDR